MKRSLALLVWIGVLFAASRAARAGSSTVGLDVHPSLLELSVEPEIRVDRSVTLTNPGAEALTVRAVVADWSMSETGEIRFGDAGGQARSCAAWIELEQERVEVPARGQAVVRVSIRAPAPFSGTRWAVVVFELPDVPSVVDGQPAIVASRIGLTVYVTAKGTEREDLEFSQAAASVDSESAKLTANFENRGNTAVRVKLTWQMRDAAGAIVKTRSSSFVSLPGMVRRVVSAWDLPPAAGTYKVIVMAKWGERRWKTRECELIVRGGARAAPS